MKRLFLHNIIFVLSAKQQGSCEYHFEVTNIDRL